MKVEKSGWIRTVWLVTGGFLFLFSMGFGSATAQDPAEEQLAAILSQLKDRFAGSKTFQSDYVRDLQPKGGSKLPPSSLQASGQLSFRLPNKLRMDQKKPRPEKLICNGEKVWWYLPEEKMVNVYRLKDYALQVKPIIDFLSGMGGWEKDFSVRLDTAVPGEAPYYQLFLKPRNPQPDLQQIRVQVSKTSFLPMECSFENLLGDGTRFRFSRIQSDVSLAGSWFEFIPPAGTQVVSPSLPVPPRK